MQRGENVGNPKAWDTDVLGKNGKKGGEGQGGGGKGGTLNVKFNVNSHSQFKKKKVAGVLSKQLASARCSNSKARGFKSFDRGGGYPVLLGGGGGQEKKGYQAKGPLVS